MDTKKCSICNLVKDVSMFYKKRDGLTHRCNSCEKDYQQKYYTRNRDKRIAVAREHSVKRVEINRKLIIEYLNENPCVDCGETDILVLQFDHRCDKKFNIAAMVSTSKHRPMSTKKILEEISKCDVRCANCHQRKTAIQVGYWKTQYLNPSVSPPSDKR